MVLPSHQDAIFTRPYHLVLYESGTTSRERKRILTDVVFQETETRQRQLEFQLFGDGIADRVAETSNTTVDGRRQHHQPVSRCVGKQPYEHSTGIAKPGPAAAWLRPLAIQT